MDAITMSYIDWRLGELRRQERLIGGSIIRFTVRGHRVLKMIRARMTELQALVNYRREMGEI